MSFGPSTSSTVNTDNPVTLLAGVTQSIVDIEAVITEVGEDIEGTDTFDTAQPVLASQVTTLQAQATALQTALTALGITVAAMGATPAVTPSVTPASTENPGTAATPVVDNPPTTPPSASS